MSEEDDYLGPVGPFQDPTLTADEAAALTRGYLERATTLAMLRGAELPPLGGYKPPFWWSFALCKGMGPAPFFPERGEDSRPAKAMCSDCPVAELCTEAGMNERFGIWGGLSERQRRARRARAA
jgi:WhiB family redox-sensing transcriptional regulator